MDNLEYIDNYFRKESLPGQRQEFDKRILEDPGFAGDVAFYISTHHVVQNERNAETKNRFREIYDRDGAGVTTGRVRPLRAYIAAAAITAGIVLGLYLFVKPGPSPRQMADQYIQQQLKTLGIRMNSEENSLQAGLRLYNEGKFPEALQQFESVIKADTSNFDAKKYTGIVYLRLKQYDKAVTYFTQLQKYTSFYANPATLYTALTLMERNQPGDVEKAKLLLQQVVQDNLEGKEIAQEWLRKL